MTMNVYKAENEPKTYLLSLLTATSSVASLSASFTILCL